MPNAQQQPGSSGAQAMLQREQAKLKSNVWENAPQGSGAILSDRFAAGDLKWNYDLAMGNVPVASMEELVQAWDWLHRHTNVGRLPMDLDLYARGMGGQVA